MDDQMMQELYRLTKDNNRMLHSMRRGAFWGGLFKLVFYAALLLVPLWFYMQYLAPVVNQALQTMQQVQGTGAQAQAQFADFQKALQNLQSQIPGLGSSSVNQ